MRKLGDKKKNRVEPAEWRPLICTPAYDGKVDVDYSMSIAESCFMAPFHEVVVTVSCMGNGAFIDLARNLFVKMFLEEHTDCTHLFFIDGDLKWPYDAFIGLVRSNLPVCAGVYRRRMEREDYPVRYAEHKDGGLWVEEYDGIPWIMCDRVPTGFLCIERKVVEEMAADARKLHLHQVDGPVPELFYTKVDEENRFIGEDFCFSDDYVKKYGEPIPVFSNIDFVHGGYECNWDVFLEKQIAESDKGTSAA